MVGQYESREDRSWERAGTDLTGRGTEDDAETVLVVAGGGHVHHLDGAAGESEGLDRVSGRRSGEWQELAMGQMEPVRAQLTTLSIVERAYSTPLRGLSRLAWFEPALASSNADWLTTGTDRIAVVVVKERANDVRAWERRANMVEMKGGMSLRSSGCDGALRAVSQHLCAPPCPPAPPQDPPARLQGVLLRGL